MTPTEFTMMPAQRRIPTANGKVLGESSVDRKGGHQQAQHRQKKIWRLGPFAQQEDQSGSSNRTKTMAPKDAVGPIVWTPVIFARVRAHSTRRRGRRGGVGRQVPCDRRRPRWSWRRALVGRRWRESELDIRPQSANPGVGETGGVRRIDPLEVGSEAEPRGHREIVKELDPVSSATESAGAHARLEVFAPLVMVVADPEDVVGPVRDHAVSGKSADDGGLDRVRIPIRSGGLHVDAEAFSGRVRQFVKKMGS